MSEKELAPHQQRVVTELDELCDKTDKLELFANSMIFNTLEYAERTRLSRQLMIMKLYQQVLSERIAAF